MDRPVSVRGTVAESLLKSLKRRGIDYVFANAGTDFAPIIEGLVNLADAPESVPTFLTIPHENLAVAMAHGYYHVAHKPAAAMVHVTVGTGNTVCALMNAYRDDVPLVLMAGRTPHTQHGHIASRSLPIHWGQENYDQAGVVREYTKWDYELRAGQPVDDVVARAVDVALAEPRGPVYLTLPREVLADDDAAEASGLVAGESAPAEPSPAHLDTLADWIRSAEFPVIVTTHTGRDLDAAARLAALADAHAIPVVESGATCVNLPASHAMNLGGGNTDALGRADLIVVVDSEVPWYPRFFNPAPATKVAHLGVDPLWSRYPIRSFPAHLAIAGRSVSALAGLAERLAAEPPAAGAVQRRREAVGELKRTLGAERAAARAGFETASPIRYDYVAACIRDALPDDGIVVTELGVSLDQLELERPGSLVGVGIGGGLGFGLGAALGAKLASPDSTVISTVGDGSYMFGNPTPAHLVAAAHDLPFLTVILNNRMWGAVRRATLGLYPDGAASRSNQAPLTMLEPSPAYEKVVEASGGYGERVEDAAELPAALERALAAVDRGQQAVLNVLTHYSDQEAVRDAKR